MVLEVHAQTLHIVVVRLQLLVPPFLRGQHCSRLILRRAILMVIVHRGSAAGSGDSGPESQRSPSLLLLMGRNGNYNFCLILFQSSKFFRVALSFKQQNRIIPWPKGMLQYFQEDRLSVSTALYLVFPDAHSSKRNKQR